MTDISIESLGISILTSSIFILVIVFMRAVFRRKISMRLQYALWLLVAVNLLLIPIPKIESSLSVLNLINNNAFSEEMPVTEEQESGMENITFWYQQTTTMLNKEFEQISENKITSEKQEELILLDILAVIAVSGSCFMLVYFVFYNLRFTLFLHKRRMNFEGYEAKLPVYLIEGLPSPCLYGRAIYITPDATTDEKMLYHVITHEYCHYRQGDLLWSTIRSICLICYWWNPFVWLAAYLSKQDCELACDEAALRILGEKERIPYGETLIGLITVKTKPQDYFSIATTMTGGGRSMKQRIRRIAGNQKAVFSVCMILVLLVGLCFISMSTAREKEEQTANVIDTEQPILIDSTRIDNEYFTMEVPEDFVNQVSYEVQLEDGWLSVRFYAESFEGDEKGILAGVRGVHITDYTEYELTENIDGAGIEDIWNQYMEQYSIGGEQLLVDISEDKTYAYEYWYPTDVQWSVDNAEKEELYFDFVKKLDTAITTFQVTKLIEEQVSKRYEAEEISYEQVVLSEESQSVGQTEELTMDRVIAMFKVGSLGTADYFSFANAQIADKKEAENNGWLNYYVNFYLPYQGETYRLGASHNVESDTLEDIYLTRESDMESVLLYTTDDRYIVVEDIEAFLQYKVDINDLLSITLPDGFTLSDYNANIGINGGVLIEPQAYEVKGEDGFGGAIPEWSHSGAISIIKYPQDWFLFEDGKLVDKQMIYWNHTSEEKLEVLEGLAMPAILYHANHDLYTAAEMGSLYEQGIELTEEELTSDYWYIYFASPESEIAYYLSLDAKQFSKEQAIEIARSVRFAQIPEDTEETIPETELTTVLGEEEAQILQDFSKVEELHAWFLGFHEIGRISDESMRKEFDGYIYFPVEQYEIHTMKELENYANQYLTKEQSQALFVKHEPKIFLEEEGVLYTLSGYIGNYDYQDGERSYQIVYDHTEQKATLTVKLSLEDVGGNMQEVIMTYQMFRAENGHWKVEGAFELPIKVLIRSVNNL